MKYTNFCITRFKSVNFILVFILLVQSFTFAPLSISANQGELIIEENGAFLTMEEFASLLESMDVDEGINSFEMEPYYEALIDEFINANPISIEFYNDEFFEDTDYFGQMLEDYDVEFIIDDDGQVWWEISEEYDGITPRNATLTLSNPTWQTMPVNNVISPASNQARFNVTSNTNWRISGNVNWLTVSQVNPATMRGNGWFIINVAPNTTTVQRQGQIRVEATGGPIRTFTFTQASASTL